MKPNPKIFDRLFQNFIEEHGRVPGVEAYKLIWDEAVRDTVEQKEAERNQRIATMLSEVNEFIELLVRMETRAEDDDPEGFENARLEAWRRLTENLTDLDRKQILEELRMRRRHNTQNTIGQYFTEERKIELDQDARRGKSGIYGMRLRARNGWKDRGDYAGKLCLITRHGWNPIVVPDGVPGLLRELGLLDRYRDKLPTHHDPVPFRRQERFDIEWERLEDGTRSFVRIVSA